MKTRAAYVTVARILRPHGRRGEVAAQVLTDFPQRLERLRSAELFDARSDRVANGGEPTAIRSFWLSHSRGRQAIFHFAGSDSIDDAKRLVGLEVQIPLADRLPLPGGSYYISDLVGCLVLTRTGQELGRVAQVEFLGRQQGVAPNLVVNTAQGELYIPLAQPICTEIDVAAQRIVVAPPEGLLELNSGS